MSTDIVHEDCVKNMAEDSALSHDSEYDDFLGVPDSLEITINEDGETISIRNDGPETIDNKGKIFHFFHIICICYILLHECRLFNL